MKFLSTFTTRAYLATAVLVGVLIACPAPPIVPNPNAPNNPTGFNGTALSTTQINLSWTASSGADTYILERKTGQGAFLVIANPTGTLYSDTGLAASTDYSYRLKANNSSGSSSGIEATVKTKDTVVTTCTTEINANNYKINTDTTWVNSASTCDYLIKVGVEVNAVLTIEAGTVIQFETETGLFASDVGRLVAVGDALNRIVMRGKSEITGFWGGVAISSSGLNEMKFVDLKDAKGGILLGGRLELTDSHIHNNLGYGLSFYTSDALNLMGFARNKFSGNTKAGISINATALKYLDAASDYLGTSSGLTPNTEPWISVTGGSLLPNDNATLLPVKYRIQSDLNVSGTLTIAAGAILEFAAGTEIAVGAKGTLIAIGTATKRIIMRGVTEEKGFWGRVGFYDSQNLNQMNFVDVKDAGRDSFFSGAVLLRNSRLELTDSHIYNSQSNGLEVVDRYNVGNEGIKSNLMGFARNKFSDSAEAGIRVDIQQVKYLDTASDYHGSGIGLIANTNPWISLGNREQPVDETTIMPALTYKFNGDITVNGHLTIAAGAILESFYEFGYISVNNSGRLTALGEPNRPIILRDQSGRSSTVYFKNATNLNQMKFFETNEIVLEDASRLELTDSYIHNSYNGLKTFSTTVNLTGFARNKFSGHQGSGITITPHQLKYLDTESDYSGTGTGLTPNIALGIRVIGGRLPAGDITTMPRATYQIDGNLEIEGNLNIAAGAILQFDHTSYLAVYGVINAIGTPTSRIVFQNQDKDLDFPWAGIYIRSNAENRLEYVDISGSGFVATGEGCNYLLGAVHIYSGGKISIGNSNIFRNNCYGIYRARNGNAMGTYNDLGGNTFAQNSLGDINP